MTLIDPVRVTAGSRIPITIDFGIDLSGYETKDFKVWKPDGTTATWAPEVYETTKLRYTTGDYDLPAADAGEWRLLPRSSRWGAHKRGQGGQSRRARAEGPPRQAVRQGSLQGRLRRQTGQHREPIEGPPREVRRGSPSSVHPGRCAEQSWGAGRRLHVVPRGTPCGLAQPRGETLSRA